MLSFSFPDCHSASAVASAAAYVRVQQRLGHGTTHFREIVVKIEKSFRINDEHDFRISTRSASTLPKMMVDWAASPAA